MKNIKYYLILITFIFISFTSFSCDMCGCYMGILPGEKQSAIAVYYRYRAFTNQSYQGNSFYPDNGSLRIQHGNHGITGGTTSSINSFEIYRVAEIRATYFIHPKVEMNLIVPYVMNSDADGAKVNRIKGLGDISVLGSYEVLDNSLANTVRQRLKLGVGIKLPSGKNNQVVGESRANILTQTGTGTTDIFLNGNYTLGYKDFGVFINLSYKLNGTNNYQEKISNSISSSSAIFYKFPAFKNLLFIPNFQCYFENTKGLEIAGVTQQGTSMKSIMLGGGVDTHYKNFSLSLSMQFPIFEYLEKDQMQSTLRSAIGLTWYFDQNNYLISSKNIKD